MVAMAILIDPPLWPAHGRLWSHLVSDTSFEELHSFARAHDVPDRGFDGDHYDVPQERYAALVTAGARAVPGRELLHRLRSAGLRRPKRRGERVLASHRDAAGRRVDLLLSALPPTRPVRGVWLLASGAAGVLAVPARGVPGAPPTWTLPRADTPPDAGPDAGPDGWSRLAADVARGLTAAAWAGPAGWRQVGYLRRGEGAAADVEVVLHRDDASEDGGPVHPPARWVHPEGVRLHPAGAVPALAPLLDAVLPALGPDGRGRHPATARPV